MRVRKLPGALQPVAIPDDSTMEVVSLKVVLRSAFGNALDSGSLATAETEVFIA